MECLKIFGCSFRLILPDFFRDCLVRLKALDLMSSLEPEVLIPQHSRPLVNKNEIRDTIQAYRDAIQFVHDQTVRYLSQGWNHMIKSMLLSELKGSSISRPPL